MHNVNNTEVSTTKNADVLTLVSGDARFVPVLGAVLDNLELRRFSASSMPLEGVTTLYLDVEDIHWL